MTQKVVLLDLENNVPTAKLLREIVEHYPTLYLFHCQGQFEYALQDLTELAAWISSGQVVILDTPKAEQKEFEYAVVVERLVGQSGWMQLSLLELDSFQHEEHLVFTGMTDTGEVLDQESCEKLFYLLATTTDLQASPPMELQTNAQRQLEATLSRALELNDQFFQQERDKLEAWADDRIASAEQALKDTKLKLKGLKRQARMALSMEDAERLQRDIGRTESEQRRQRQEIFAVEDEIEARRDALIAALQKRLHRASRNQSLFVLRWSVV